jgi:hypothetical protein
MSRHTANTLDGATVYESETAQGISDAVIAHLEAGRKPTIAYTFDNAPGTIWPYTTWRRSEQSGAWLGSPWKTFGEVVAVVGQSPISVRVLVGAEAAYACIKTGTTSLDVRLPPGKSAGAAMREVAAEMTEKAEMMLERARLIESASYLT